MSVSVGRKCKPTFGWLRLHYWTICYRLTKSMQHNLAVSYARERAFNMEYHDRIRLLLIIIVLIRVPLPICLPSERNHPLTLIPTRYTTSLGT